MVARTRGVHLAVALVAVGCANAPQAAAPPRPAAAPGGVTAMRHAVQPPPPPRAPERRAKVAELTGLVTEWRGAAPRGPDSPNCAR